MIINCFIKYGSCCKKALIVYKNGKILVIGGEIIDVLSTNDVEDQKKREEVILKKKEECNNNVSHFHCCVKYAKILTLKNEFPTVFDLKNIFNEYKHCTNANVNNDYDHINFIRQKHVSLDYYNIF